MSVRERKYEGLFFDVETETFLKSPGKYITRIHIQLLSSKFILYIELNILSIWIPSMQFLWRVLALLGSWANFKIG